MSFEEFVAEYERTISDMLKYEINQVGALHFAEKAADLADNYPEYMELYDNQH